MRILGNNIELFNLPDADEAETKEVMQIVEEEQGHTLTFGQDTITIDRNRMELTIC